MIYYFLNNMILRLLEPFLGILIDVDAEVILMYPFPVRNYLSYMFLNDLMMLIMVFFLFEKNDKIFSIDYQNGFFTIENTWVHLVLELPSSLHYCFDMIKRLLFLDHTQ